MTRMDTVVGRPDAMQALQTDGVRVRDPATRDQDPKVWRRGRFAERVRREWNPIPTQVIESARRADGYDLEALAAAIHARVGGDVAPIRDRLGEFVAAEAAGAAASPDPLTRPGAP